MSNAGKVHENTWQIQQPNYTAKIENKEDTKHTIKSSRHSAVRKQTYVKKTIFD